MTSTALEGAEEDSRVRPGVFLMTNSLETGGSERQFAGLAGSIDRGKFDVRLGCVMRKGSFGAGLGEIAEFGLGGSLYGAQSWRTRLQLARHLSSSDISIAHSFDFYTNLLLIPAARWAGVPVVIGSQRQLGDLLTWKQERAQAAVLRWCDAVACNSRAAAERLMRLGVREDRVALIGNGLAHEFFEVRPRDRGQGRARVGMIARMNSAAKNHKLFLRMAARVRSQRNQVQFVLVGDGPLRAELEKLARDLGIVECVEFAGERADMPAVLSTLDMTVVPSESESLSNAILESMAAGVPVVASRVGGNCELIADNRGLLVAPGDERGLAEGVSALLGDPALRESFARNGSKFAQENHSQARMTALHEQLYEDLLAARRSGRSSTALEGSRGRVRRQRIVIVAASSRFIGGQSVQAASLMQNWAGDADVSAQFIAIDPEFPTFLRWVERVPFVRTMVRQPIYLWKLWRGLKGTDVAHVFSASYWAFLIAVVPACRIARWRGARIVVHYHSGEAREHLKTFPGASDALRNVDRLIVPSPYLVEVFREFRVDAEAIPNIVDLSQFGFRARRPLRPHLICTRGFHPYYCVDVVVRAFAEIRKHFPDAQLDLAGGGSLEPGTCQLVSELGLQGVSFKGIVSRTGVARCYDEADIFINASQLDNMPVSILEAFASGLPVVSTEPEGMRYVVEHERTGLLSPVGDAEALARNVIRLLRDAELSERLATTARQDVERCSWPVVRGKWLQVYRNVGAEGKG